MIEKEISFFKRPDLNSSSYSHHSARTAIQPEIKPARYSESQLADKTDYLVAFSTSAQSYCVGCVDMVNSTKISASISSDKLCMYYEIFLNSMSKIIGQFGGKVIKNIGDCLLYYFPDSTSSKSNAHSRYISCGLAMICAQPVLCQHLVSKKLPCLSYRISADFGQVLLMSTTDSLSVDLIGPPVNMCAKINRCAGKNEFVIGGDLYETVKKSAGCKFELVSSYDVGFRFSYPVYKVSLPSSKSR